MRRLVLALAVLNSGLKITSCAATKEGRAITCACLSQGDPVLPGQVATTPRGGRGDFVPPSGTPLLSGTLGGPAVHPFGSGRDVGARREDGLNRSREAHSYARRLLSSFPSGRRATLVRIGKTGSFRSGGAHSHPTPAASVRPGRSGLGVGIARLAVVRLNRPSGRARPPRRPVGARLGRGPVVPAPRRQP